MSYFYGWVGAILFGLSLFLAVGCGSSEAEVAPRDEDEIEAYKAEVYGAEEEMDLESEE